MIRKGLCSLALVMGLSLASFALASTANEEDAGFKNPLQQLNFNPALEHYQFERSTFGALRVYDPFETMNRHIYHFNYKFDQYVFLPTVAGYRKVTPQFVRTGISNFYNNLSEVSTLANSLLQGKFQRAMHSASRLLFNTILGVGGLWDPASAMGLVRIEEDFGQTLGFYGVPDGPYLMLPLLGPSNLRDSTGLVADFILEREVNLLNYAETNRRHPELYLMEGINKRYVTQMRYGQMNSPFEYEKLRYIYTKSREMKINK